MQTYFCSTRSSSPLHPASTGTNGATASSLSAMGATAQPADCPVGLKEAPPVELAEEAGAGAGVEDHDGASQSADECGSAVGNQHTLLSRYLPEIWN